MSTPEPQGFGTFVPGFEFMQSLARQAAGMVPGAGPAAQPLPHLAGWVAPTFSVEDLEKRIQELKTVQFWLEQNTRALAATIQALEVQKMTLSTLQGMNLSLGDVAQALKANATDAMAQMAGFASAVTQPPAAASAPVPEAPAAAPFAAPVEAPAAPTDASVDADPAATAGTAPPSAGVVDPMRWWGALTEQFQAIATHAMNDVAAQAAQAAQAGAAVAAAATEPVKAAVSSEAATPSKPARAAKVASAPTPAKPKQPAATAPSAPAKRARTKPAAAPAPKPSR